MTSRRGDLQRCRGSRLRPRRVQRRFQRTRNAERHLPRFPHRAGTRHPRLPDADRRQQRKGYALAHQRLPPPRRPRRSAGTLARRRRADHGGAALRRPSPLPILHGERARVRGGYFLRVSAWRPRPSPRKDGERERDISSRPLPAAPAPCAPTISSPAPARQPQHQKRRAHGHQPHEYERSGEVLRLRVRMTSHLL